MADFIVGQWVECVDDSDQCNMRHGLKKGEFYRVSRLRETFDEIYIDGLGQSLFQHRFRPFAWQVGRTYRTTLEGVTATIRKVEGGVVWNRMPGWRHATEPISDVTYHETTGKLRYCEDRDDVPHLTPYLADESQPSCEKQSSDMHTFDTGAVRGTDANGARFDLISPHVLQALAETYAEGSKKYGDDNWLRGIPSKDLMNHALRHINLWQLGDTTEDHLAHAMWNLGAIIHFQKTRPELIVRQYATAMEKEPGRE